MSSADAELSIEGATLITCDDQGRVLRANLRVRDGRIVAVGRGRTQPGTRRIDARDCVVLPGFVMAHVHLCQTLIRGAADDLPLLDWLRERVWPMEAAHDDRSLRASAEVGLAELALGGCTTLLDLGTVHGHDAVFDACVGSGLRVIGGKSLMDQGDGVPPSMVENTRDALSDAERLAEHWSGHPSGRIGFAWLPRFILSCTEELIRGAAARAEQRGELFHTHAAEHPDEKRTVRTALGADDVTVLRRWGLRGEHSSIAHGVQLTARQMSTLSSDGVGVVHCPTANLKLGSGVANVPELLARGVRVGLGADGAPCNNNLDPLTEIRHAALVAAMRWGPGALPAQRVLDLATRGGAELMGLGDELGSLEVGKRADLVVLRLDGPHVSPYADPVSAVVYAARASDVRHVLVEGAPIVRDHELCTLDAERVAATARKEQKRLLRRAGLA